MFSLTDAISIFCDSVLVELVVGTVGCALRAAAAAGTFFDNRFLFLWFFVLFHCELWLLSLDSRVLFRPSLVDVILGDGDS